MTTTSRTPSTSTSTATSTPATATPESSFDQPFATGNIEALDAFEMPTPRRWPYLLAGIGIGVATAVIGSMLLASSNEGGNANDAIQANLATAPVEVRDLIEEVEWLADLGYGDTIQIVAQSDATVTATVETGSLLNRGDIVVELDNQPVVVLYGHVPVWRPLQEGIEGSDVEQLEVNLVALGYDPDNLVTINDTFSAATTEMVERWQADLGAEVTGTVDTSSVVVVAGPVEVTEPAMLGQRLRAGIPVAAVSLRTDTETIVGRGLGEVEMLAPVGTEISHGSIIYETSNTRVQALTEPDSFATMLLDPETDPVQFESALVFAGHSTADNLAVDGIYDAATADAVAAWQRATGLAETGEYLAVAYVLVPEGTTVVDHLTAVGDTLAVARPIMELGTSTLSVVVPVGLADQDEFSAGQQVSVELPNDSMVLGLVTEVGTVATEQQPNEPPTIDVTVEFTELTDEVLPATEVTVIVAGETVEDALVVPTRALVTLSEGGFAVEKVLADETTVLVAVETGVFDDGVVEVESSQLEPGDQLVVPQ